MLTLKTIEWGSEDYQKALALRDEVLRRPVGLSLFDEDLQREKALIHVAAYLDDVFCGTLQFTPLGNGVLRLGQVVVKPDCRGQGIGAAMLRYGEALMRERGYTAIEVHARLTAVGFYEKQGYRIEGPAFLEKGVQHRVGRKKLAPPHSEKKSN